jgi:hypothetical protein
MMEVVLECYWDTPPSCHCGRASGYRNGEWIALDKGITLYTGSASSTVAQIMFLELEDL